MLWFPVPIQILPAGNFFCNMAFVGLSFLEKFRQAKFFCIGKCYGQDMSSCAQCAVRLAAVTSSGSFLMGVGMPCNMGKSSFF